MPNPNKIVFAVLIIVGVICLVLAFSLKPKPEVLSNQIKLCTWNLDNFGVVKSSNLNILNSITNEINSCDIFLVEDIRDTSGDSFKLLCDSLDNYICYYSSVKGIYQEQYGILWKKIIKNPIIVDYNQTDEFNAPPVWIRFNINYPIDIYYLHTDKDNITKELNNLNLMVPNVGNTLIMGDLHNDCIYDKYNFDGFSSLQNYGTSDGCVYERVYGNSNIINYLNSSGIDSNFTQDVSINAVSWIKLNK